MLELANSASGVFAPLLAGALLGIIGISGIMIIPSSPLPLPLAPSFLSIFPSYAGGWPAGRPGPRASHAGGGHLASTFGWLVGTGDGADMALILVVCGVLAAMVGLGGCDTRIIRDVEDILPDFYELPEEATAAVAT